MASLSWMSPGKVDDVGLAILLCREEEPAVLTFARAMFVNVAWESCRDLLCILLLIVSSSQMNRLRAGRTYTSPTTVVARLSFLSLSKYFITFSTTSK